MRYLSCVLALVTGCSLDVPAPTQAGAVPTTITLTGAQTGTFNAVITAAWTPGNNLSVVTFTISQGASNPAIVGFITFAGQLKLGHYTNGDANVTGGVSTSTSSTIVWLTSASTTNPPGGTFDLNLTGLGTAVATTTQTNYVVSGTLDAVMPPAINSTATGTVTLHATF